MQLLHFARLRVRLHRPLTLPERAAWLRRGSRAVMRRLNFRLDQQGAAPSTGLIVSNHLSHFDILAYSVASGCIFLAKSEVSRWPLFGLLARCGGTIFVERDRAQSAARCTESLRGALEAGVPVLIFPEGTTTGGDAVLPFRSMLFEPAIACGSPIAPAALGYSAATAPERTLCYYGEHSFLPHLYQSLQHSGLCARVEWLGEPTTHTCRKQAAHATHAAIDAARSKPLDPAHASGAGDSSTAASPKIEAAPGAGSFKHA